MLSPCFPTLDVKGVRIVAFDQKHLTSRYVSWLNDPAVVRFSEQRHHQHTLSTCKQYFESVKKTSNYFLAIEVNDQELGHIGNMGVTVDAHNLVSDLSIVIGEKRAWGMGYASIAWNAVLQEMLCHQGVRKVTAGTMAVNEPMLRIMKRSGMHIEAVRRNHFLWHEHEVDLIQTAIFSNKIGS